MELDNLQAEVAQWAGKNFPLTPPHRPLLGLAEEVGELSHAHLKLEQGIRGSKEELIEQKRDAVGDIMIYLAHYCEVNDLNLDDCVEIAWREVKARDWTKNRKDGKQ